MDSDIDRENYQTFAGWANMHLRQRDMQIQNLETDLCDGAKLIALLEVLNGKTIEGRYYKNPKSKPYFIANVNFAINFITETLGIKLISCSAEGKFNGFYLRAKKMPFSQNSTYQTYKMLRCR